MDGLDSKRVVVAPGMDLRAPIDSVTRAQIGPIDVIMNVASESHVDRSISEAATFIRNNVELITSLLDFARQAKPRMFLQMSTDEVYGPAPEGIFHGEWESIRPSNPYSASKAAQEAICFSYWRTYGVPVVITNTMNIIGETQNSEKFVPKIISRILSEESVPVHVSPEGKPGSRFYLHARNLADAWLFLMDNHVAQLYPKFFEPSRFNIVGDKEINNIEMANMIADLLGETDADIYPVDFHNSRPGHDLRYALDGTKIRQLGWQAPISFESSVERTVSWTLNHPEWLK
jgi:dTDP-glucose 4,6-dehydratase